MCKTAPGEEKEWVREMRVEDEGGGRRLRVDEASRGLIGAFADSSQGKQSTYHMY